MPPPDEDHLPASPPLQIAGATAGNIAMFLFLTSLSMLFLASIAAFLIIRVQYLGKAGNNTWPPVGFPPIPNSLWFSNFVILATSVTIQLASNAIKVDNEKSLLLYLRLTFGLALLFLGLQTFNWFDFYFKLRNSNIRIEGAYLGGFFTLTLLHAAHVIGGLIPLAVVLHHARKSRYSRNFHPGVRYCTLYFHFLDIVWLALFCVLYF